MLATERRVRIAAVSWKQGIFVIIFDQGEGHTSFAKVKSLELLRLLGYCEFISNFDMYDPNLDQFNHKAIGQKKPRTNLLS